MATDGISSITELNETLEADDLIGQWELVRKQDETPDEVAKLWKWDEVYDALQLIKDNVNVEEIPHEIRPHVSLVNPPLRDLPGPSGIARNLVYGFHVAEPGANEKVHRHTLTAYRFIVQGNDSFYTIVNGEELPLRTGDLVLTPRMTWHGHRNDSNEDGIWQSGLDVPFVSNVLDAAAFEPEATVEEKNPGYYNNLFQDLRPRESTNYVNYEELDDATGYAPSPPYRFPWEDCRDVLMRAAENEQGYDPYDGIRLEYVNPATGAPPVLETMSLRLQLLRRSEETESHRHASSEVYFVVEGSGTTDVGDETLSWERHDSFVVPKNTWHSHAADDETIFFVVSDRPLYDAFNVHVEEGK